MQFPQRFSALPEHAFSRLRRLLAGDAPGGPEIATPEWPNPGEASIRAALVAGPDDITRGLGAIRALLDQPQSIERV